MTQSDVEYVLNMARRKVLRYLLKHGYVIGEASDDEGEHAHGSALAICTKASMLDRVAIGKRAGQLVARLYDEPPPPKPRGARCAELENFTLHANTQTAPRDRLGLERLCRYMCRPSFSVHRMEQLPNGDILFKLKTTWANGVVAKVFEPLDLMAKMAALVVKPRVNLLRYHGQFAANAGWRKEICPGKKPEPKPRGDQDGGNESPLSPSERSSWALMLKRCFQIDVLQCPCGARCELIATIPPGPVAKQILDHVGEPSEPPRFKRPRPPPTDHW